MAVYLIGYDLKAPGRNYDDLYLAIKSLGSWCKPLDSEWLVDTTKNATVIHSVLKPKLDANDLILINKFSGDYFGTLSPAIWTWLKEHLT